MSCRAERRRQARAGEHAALDLPQSVRDRRQDGQPARVIPTVQEARRARLQRSCLVSLAAFVRFAWPMLNPGTPLIWGKHLDLICCQLEAVTAGRSARITVINIPPGHCKTTIISVCWPVWEWLHQPENRWIFATNARDLATRDNEARRDLIKDERFQALFKTAAGGKTPEWQSESLLTPLKVRPRRPGWSLSRGKDQKTKFSNNLRGSMMALSVGSRVTGNHADRLVIDDPLDAGDIWGPQLAGHVAWYRDKLSTRVRDGARIVLVMQRLHQDDLAGVLLARAREEGTLGQPGGVDLLCFPTHYDPDDAERQTCTVTGLADWRTAHGELLWPQRFSQPILDGIEAEMTPGGWASQYEQLTIVLEGMLLRPEWWGRYVDLPPVGRWCITVDPTTGSTSSDADFTVAQCWLLCPPNAYLVKEIRGRWSDPEALDLIADFVAEFPAVQEIIVEDKARGRAWIQHLEAKGIRHIKAFNPQGIPKEARIDTAGGVAKAGRLHIPAKGEDVGWDVEAFVDECQRYPRGKDDRPDAMAQFVHVHLDQLWGRRRPRAPSASQIMPTRQEVAGKARSGGTKAKPKATSRPKADIW